MSKEKFKHFSLTTDWLESKSKFSKWGIFISNNGKKHLILRIKNIFAIHWFSYILQEDLKNEIDETINSKDSFLIHLSILKLLNLPYVNNKSRKIFLFKTSKNFKTFIIPTKSSTNSRAENFIINLNTWNINSLSKNWKRNLKRSERSFKNFSYKEVDLLKDLDMVYEIIIKSATMKKYTYPYTKDFLSEVIKKSYKNIIALGCFNSKNELIAIRAFYKVDEIAIDFIAAALPESLKDYVTYNIAFNLIMRSKNLGLKSYNMGGADLIINKGVFNFKKGIGGKLISDGQIYSALTIKDYVPNFLSKIILKILSNLL